MTHSPPIGSLCLMPHIKIPGVKAYVSNGKVYAYHCATGKRLKSLYGSPEFFAEVEALRTLQTTPEPSRGTWGALVAGYRASPKFQEEIQPRTRKDYQKVLD